MRKRIIVGITGASGSIYAFNFLRAAYSMGIDLCVVASDSGMSVFEFETGRKVRDVVDEISSGQGTSGSIKLYDNNDIFSDIASGTFKTDGMVIVPCTMKTLSGVANGYSGSLLERSADVVLKEKRPLVLVVRETPFSLVHLKNMTSAAESGAIILPASPAYYHGPGTISDLADFMSGKIFDQLGIEHNLNTRWAH